MYSLTGSARRFAAWLVALGVCTAAHSQVFTDLRSAGFLQVVGVGSLVEGPVIIAEGPQALPIIRWTRETGSVGLPGPSLPSGGWFDLEDVSADASVIVGRAPGAGENRNRDSAYRWEVGGQVQEVTTNIRDSNWRSSSSVSPDGSAVAGFGAIAGFRWTQETGVQLIGAKLDGVDVPGPDNQFFTPRDLSLNGLVIVGTHQLGLHEPIEPARWSADTGPVSLAFPTSTNAPSGTALGVSDDGSIVVGGFGANSTQAFRWSEATGMVDLGVVPGTRSSIASAISADGSMIFGTTSTSLPNSVQPFVWTVETGMRHLVDLLTEEYGVGEAIEGWQLGRITAVSNDGRYIVGEGTSPDNGTGTWLVDLGFAPVPEPAAFGLAASIALILMCWRQRHTTYRAP